MADGDGVAGSEWYGDRARAEYGGPFNLGPLATATPEYVGPTLRAPFTPGFAQPPPMGLPAPVKLEMPLLSMRSSLTLGPGASRSSALSVVTSTPAYTSHGAHPRSILPSGLIEAGASIASFPSASSGDLTQAAVLPQLDTQSADIPMPSPSTIRRDIITLDPTDPKRVGPNSNLEENASFPITASIPSSTNLPSSNPSIICFADPPLVPESFPRDPVPQGGRGKGWPYAPQGWPKPEDKWGWRVGKRASANLLWIDRYVSVPVSLLKGRRSVEFASRKSLVEYCRQNFLQMQDPYNIFKAFDWKVPAPKDFGVPEKRGPTTKRDKLPPADGEDNWQKSKKQCQAGNVDCLLTKAKDSGSKSLGSLVCYICCSEPGFCRECKCILCCKYFRPDADDFSVIRCFNLPVPGQGICGHAAHLECALDSQLARVIKKNGLDMEYICRRCDRKTDLRETVSRLVEVMGKTSTQSKVESSLQLVLRIVQDPEDEARSSGKTPATLIGDSFKKVQEGADTVEIYKGLTQQLYGLQAGEGVYDSQVSHQVFNCS